MNRFIDAFSESQLNSIDAFLGRNVEDPEVGKRLVAYVLLRQESEARMFEDVPDHWYRYMHNELVNSVSEWEELDLSWLSIVTFNYDRSLEHFLAQALARTFKRSYEEALEKIADLRIVHVYGSLGSLDNRKDKTFTPFGNIQENHFHFFVKRAASGLQVVQEGRVDSPSFTAAQGLIRESNVIYFLGFGFDKTNIERLGAPGTFLVDSQHQKNIYSTVFGLTTAETSLACQRVTGNGLGGAMRLLAMNTNCLSLVRENLPFTAE